MQVNMGKWHYRFNSHVTIARNRNAYDKRVTTSLRTWAVARNDGRDHVDSGWHVANVHLESVGPGQ